MNPANENLKIIRTQKAQITNAYNKAKNKLEEKYAEDIRILNKEEKELLKQFKDIPVNDIYKKEEKE